MKGAATVVCIQSTEQWEAFQKQREQMKVSLGLIPSALSLDTTTTTLTESSQKKKKRPTGQRDNLTRRMNLLKGKEGSRRRQRWNNNQVAHLGPIEIEKEDMLPLSSSASSFCWHADMLDMLEAQLDWLPDQERSVGHHRSMPLPRSYRHELKRTHLPSGMVTTYEHKLVQFLQDDRDRLVLDIDNSFSRWLVHSLCRYYRLQSHSSNTPDGRRIMSVWGKDGSLVPKMTFSEYMGCQ